MRLLQMGEPEERVHHVGSPALDAIKATPPLSKDALAERFGFQWHERMILATYHPVTRGEKGLNAQEQISVLLSAIEALPEGYGVVFTAPNADNGGQKLREQIELFVSRNERVYFVPSFGHAAYMSMLHYVTMLLGNTSSALYEAPSFSLPAINLGSRQDGRLKAGNVVDCDIAIDAIEAAVTRCESLDVSTAVNPYGDGNAVERIMAVLNEIDDFKALLYKPFNMVAHEK